MRNWIHKLSRWLSPVTVSEARQVAPVKSADVVEYLDKLTDGPAKDWVYLGKYRVFMDKKK